MISCIYISGRRLLLMTATILICSARSLEAQVYEKDPYLHGDIITLPVVLINGYPFVPGTVNGISGKFMFDTGYLTSISINDNYVELPEKKEKTTGVMGSGQVFRTSVNDTIREIRFPNGMNYRNLRNIGSGNYDFLQKALTPDFLGYVGHQFFEGYLFKLDYIHKKITFYKKTPQRSRSKDFLAGEKVLTVIDFELRKLPNHPIAKLAIGSVNVLAAFDTGQNGSLQLDAASATMLLRNGIVTRSGVDSGGDTLLTVAGIRTSDHFKFDLKGVEQIAAGEEQIGGKAIGITEPRIMNLGYRFLASYKTVWDYSDKKIYVLEY